MEFPDFMFSDPELFGRVHLNLQNALDAAAAAMRNLSLSSLPFACRNGDLDTVRSLLDGGHDVNEVTKDGDSLIALVSSLGNTELAQLLLARKANVEDRGRNDLTPLMKASYAGHLDVVKLLIQHGADVNARTTRVSYLKEFERKEDMNDTGTADEEREILQYVRGPCASPKIFCPQNHTPLMFACSKGHEDIVKVLLDAEAGIEDYNEDGCSPLMEAAKKGYVGVARLLVERGASISSSHLDECPECALTLACRDGHLEMVRFLLEATPKNESYTGRLNDALFAVCENGHPQIAKLLLDAGAQLSMPASAFESPLTVAVFRGHVELVKLLLDYGAAIEDVNEEGNTPLMEAIGEGKEEMLSLLLSRGANINAQNKKTGETALSLACFEGHEKVADFLLKAGADIELGTLTPLMEAAKMGHLNLVKYLISSGANVEAISATGNKAVTYAFGKGYTEIADLLLEERRNRV